jgi:DNA polymerase elongation subunit (family B)
MNRCKKLNLDVSWLSPTGQWYEHKIKDRNRDVIVMLPQHKLIVDYMAIYQKWDRSVEVKENDTLDFVAEEALGVTKIKYPGTLQELYEKDYSQFIFYNAIDTVLIELLNTKLKTMGTFLGLGNITRVEAMTAFSPIAMLEATLTRYGYERGQVFPKREERKERQSYEGAFVFEPIPNLYEWVASFDFASLYPSIMRQFKLSIENFMFKDKAYSPKNTEIKAISGSVFESSYEPLIPEILTTYYGKRKDAKKVSLTAEKEADALSHILSERKKSAQI